MRRLALVHSKVQVYVHPTNALRERRRGNRKEEEEEAENDSDNQGKGAILG